MRDCERRVLCLNLGRSAARLAPYLSFSNCCAAVDGFFFPLCPWSNALAWQTQLCGERNFIIITPLMISAMPRMLGASSF